jgi:hypothetical protein
MRLPRAQARPPQPYFPCFAREVEKRELPPFFVDSLEKYEYLPMSQQCRKIHKIVAFSRRLGGRKGEEL